MYELVYHSTSVPNLTLKDIEDILEKSRENNSKMEISGCLLYYNSEFLQLLEGEKQQVQDLFSTIQKDRRHKHVILLNEDSKDQRVFPDWRMTFHDFNTSKLEADSFKKELIQFSEIANRPSLAIDLFWTMAKYMAA